MYKNFAKKVTNVAQYKIYCLFCFVIPVFLAVVVPSRIQTHALTWNSYHSTHTVEYLKYYKLQILYRISTFKETSSVHWK